jgi:hypothetical protein
VRGLQGVRQIKKYSKQVHLGRILDLGGTQRGYKFDLGVRRGDTILIWGYASTKRLRTPGVVVVVLNQ